MGCILAGRTYIAKWMKSSLLNCYVEKEKERILDKKIPALEKQAIDLPRNCSELGDAPVTVVFVKG